MEIEPVITEPELSPAERHYQRHCKAVATYQKKNPDKMSAKYKKWYSTLKANEDKYKQHLQQHREYYLTHIKPKKDLAKQQKQEAKEKEKKLMEELKAELKQKEIELMGELKAELNQFKNNILAN